MLLTITTTHQPATDLGYLLAKNPAHEHSFELAFGRAHVFYPEADEQRCTAALLLDIDPVGLVRGRGEGSGLLDQYVNDRPYVASSFLSVAIAEVFGSALNGRSRERPELAATPIPLAAFLPALPTRGGADIIRRLMPNSSTAQKRRTISFSRAVSASRNGRHWCSKRWSTRETRCASVSPARRTSPRMQINSNRTHEN